MSPSASLWHVASSRPPEPGRRVVAAGPGLPSAQAEVEATSAIHQTTPPVGTAATVEAVSTALDGAGLAHLAADGHVRTDNPLFSSLRLAAFLSHGTRQLVASVVPVLDAETAPLMVAFHRLLAIGHPPADALGRAQQRISEDEPMAKAAAAAFVCIGAGLTPQNRCI